LQSLGVRALIDAGEFFARLIPRRTGDYNFVPLQLQLLEADHLDETFNSIDPGTGNEIRMGIEIDPSGKRARPITYFGNIRGNISSRPV
jgi:capsid protein